jgi:hypothetical protein
MDNLWDVSYVSVEGDADGHQADSQGTTDDDLLDFFYSSIANMMHTKTGPDNKPIELGSMDQWDESESEDISSETMQPTTAKPNVRSSAARATSHHPLSTDNPSAKTTKLAVNNTNIRQPETQGIGPANQNATAGSNASGPQSEAKGSLKRVHGTSMI